MKHVVVIGGGVMGSSASWHLASRGSRVTLLEQFSPGHTNGSSHGSSRIFRVAYPDPFYIDLAARALPLWRQLEHESDQAVLTITGAVDHGPPHVVAGLHTALRVAGHSSHLLRSDDAAERWPGMLFDTSVLFHPTAGRLRADRAVEALQIAAQRKGATIRSGVRVAALRRRHNGTVEIITANDEVIAADAAVVAVGGWAPGLAANSVDGLPPLRVTQEQPVHFPVRAGLSWPSFIHHGGAALPPDAGVYGLGSVDGIKVGFHAVGPTVDPDRRDRTIDISALRAVQNYAAAWLPGVDHTAPAASTCLYTITPDHDFVIDRDGPVTVLGGFSGHGFKFGSVIGELAADLVDGKPRVERFALGRHRAQR